MGQQILGNYLEVYQYGGMEFGADDSCSDDDSGDDENLLDLLHTKLLEEWLTYIPTIYPLLTHIWISYKWGFNSVEIEAAINYHIIKLPVRTLEVNNCALYISGVYQKKVSLINAADTNAIMEQIDRELDIEGASTRINVSDIRNSCMHHKNAKRWNQDIAAKVGVICRKILKRDTCT